MAETESDHSHFASSETALGHGVSPSEMAFEAKRFRHVAIAIAQAAGSTRKSLRDLYI
jgi:hypothetical protein